MFAISASFPRYLKIVIAKSLGFNITSNNLSNVFQSAYKQFFNSTDTALVNVHSGYIPLNLDNGKVTAVALLDLPLFLILLLILFS